MNKKIITIFLVFLCTFIFSSCSSNYNFNVTHTHNVERVDRVEPTCEEDGNIEYWHCSECDKNFANQNCTVQVSSKSLVLKALGHDFSTKEDVSPTCKEDGYINYQICNRCGYETFEVVTSTGHTLTHYEKVSSTCTNEGNIEYWHCSDCDKYFLDEQGNSEISESEIKIPMIPHDLSKVDEVLPTATTDGNIEYYKCNVCGKNFNENNEELTESEIIIPKLTYTYEIKLDHRELNDGCIIDSNGETSRVNDSIHACSSYIDCYRVGEITLTMISKEELGLGGLAFYDSTKSFIKYIEPNYSGNASGVDIVTVEVPLNAHYFRTTYYNFNYCLENSIEYFSCEISYPKESGLIDGYRPYQDGYIFYSPVINNGKIYSDNKVEIKLKDTTGVLLLPKNYSPTGSPVPVVIYFHGYSHYVAYEKWGNTDNFRKQMQQYADAGFAVIDCNGPKNGNNSGTYTLGNYSHAGLLQDVNAYKECFEYVKQYYNVEESPFVIGGSAGGISAANYAIEHPTKGLILISAWFDLKEVWGYGGTSTTYKEYTDIGSASEIATKGFGMNPALRYFTDGEGNELFSGINCPVYSIIGSNEVSSTHIYPPLKRLWSALKNSGVSIYCKEINGYNHSQIVSGAVEDIVNDYVNWMKMYCSPENF